MMVVVADSGDDGSWWIDESDLNNYIYGCIPVLVKFSKVFWISNQHFFLFLSKKKTLSLPYIYRTLINSNNTKKQTKRA